MPPALPPDLPPEDVIDVNGISDELQLESFGYKQGLLVDYLVVCNMFSRFQSSNVLSAFLA